MATGAEAQLGEEEDRIDGDRVSNASELEGVPDDAATPGGGVEDDGDKEAGGGQGESWGECGGEEGEGWGEAGGGEEETEEETEARLAEYAARQAEEDAIRQVRKKTPNVWKN